MFVILLSFSKFTRIPFNSCLWAGRPKVLLLNVWKSHQLLMNNRKF